MRDMDQHGGLGWIWFDFVMLAKINEEENRRRPTDENSLDRGDLSEEVPQPQTKRSSMIFSERRIPEEKKKVSPEAMRMFQLWFGDHTEQIIGSSREELTSLQSQTSPLFESVMEQLEVVLF